MITLNSPVDNAHGATEDHYYNTENYYDLIKPILKKETKIVYGSRVLGKRKRTRPSTFDFKIRN